MENRMEGQDSIMKWQVKLTERKILRGIILSGWRSLLLPIGIFTFVVIFTGIIAIFSFQQSSGEVAISFLVPFFSYMLIIVLTYAFSIWIVARMTYKRVMRQGGSDVQTHEIVDGMLIYSAAGDTIRLTLANISVVGQYPGVIVLKRQGNRRFYLLFDSADEQAKAAQILAAIHP
jgi:hypothetical protein